MLREGLIEERFSKTVRFSESRYIYLLEFRKSPLREGENGQKICPSDSKPVNRCYFSTTDLDAALIRRNSGTSKPRYQVHRAVDGQSEVITSHRSDFGRNK